jgi:4-carboxymuconolactone decarboxylase
MTDEDLQTKGRAMRRHLYGEEATDKLDQELYDGDPIMERFRDLTESYIFGALWSRPGLDLKTRSIATVAADVSTGQVEALGLHLRYARRQGFTEDELVEVILHLTGYVGVPNVRKALIVARDTFAQLREDSSGPAAPE